MLITQNTIKPRDLTFKLSTLSGTGHLQRNLAFNNATYNLESQGEQRTVLQPGQEILLGAVSVLQVSTNKPLMVYARVDSETVLGLVARRILLMDQPFQHVQIRNMGEEDAQVYVVWASDQSSIVPPPWTDGWVHSVNGIGPDDQGNVVIDTGVMTINGNPPDDQGNVDLDEGDYIEDQQP